MIPSSDTVVHRLLIVFHSSLISILPGTIFGLINIFSILTNFTCRCSRRIKNTSIYQLPIMCHISLHNPHKSPKGRHYYSHITNKEKQFQSFIHLPKLIHWVNERALIPNEISFRFRIYGLPMITILPFCELQWKRRFH